MRYTIENPTGDQDIFLESFDAQGTPALKTGLEGTDGVCNTYRSAGERDQALKGRLDMFRDQGMTITEA